MTELGQSAQPQCSTVVPVEAEMFKCINYIKSVLLEESDVDLLPCPLTFYSKGKVNYGGDNVSILSRITSVIFVRIILNNRCKRSFTNEVIYQLKLTKHRLFRIL